MKHALIIKNLILICLPAIAVLLFIIPVHASGITQGYSSDESLELGMIVGLDKTDLTKVNSINSSQNSQMLGVIIAPNQSSVLLSNNSQNNYVASSGTYNVLVSNQNGAINSGDYIAPSSVSGIGYKAGLSDNLVLGKALSSFNPNNSNEIVGTASVKDSNGKTSQLTLGYVQVDISIASNPLIKVQDDLPGILKKAGQNITGKPVSAARIYIGLLLMAITATISGSLIYSGVRSSMIAMGRNPLSRKTISKGLFQVVFISLMVFMTGIFGVYLILKL